MSCNLLFLQIAKYYVMLIAFEYRQSCVDGRTMDKALVKSFPYDSSSRACLVVFEDLLSHAIAQWFDGLPLSCVVL